jgi:ABC-type Zn uptake system ZnuABC Zn-binding protein ZnuA
MWTKAKVFLAIASITLLGVSSVNSNTAQQGNVKTLRGIVTSDTLLSGMIALLLPPNRYSIEAILPPGQCPGHYDLKLSDIEKMKKADLTVSFRRMPIMDKAGLGGEAQLLVDAEGHNWMAPDSYLYGLAILATGLAKRFPADEDEIVRRKEEAIRKVMLITTLF